MQDDFFSAYFNHTAETEVPRIFHRWCAIAGIGALLGRSYHYPFGDIGNVYPNIYCMLLGEPGTKKSTAIKQMVRLLLRAGYVHIGPNETSKEKFLMDLEEGIDYYSKEGEETAKSTDLLLDRNLFGETDRTVSECLVPADEANNFFGINNLSFISTLGEIWDYDGIFKKKFKNSKSVWIPNPTLSILAGNTATNYALAFPTQILGQGFFSRLIHVYGEATGIRIDDPQRAPEAVTNTVLDQMKYIRTRLAGSAEKTGEAAKLLKHIYNTWPGVDDVRFSTYANRRFTHLLKLTLIHTAARFETRITEADVVYANTVLTYTENFMPKALGEFGKAKHSDVTNKIVNLLETAIAPVTLKDVWRHVHNDLEKMNDLSELIRNLVMADKIQTVQGGFLAKKKVKEEVDDGTIEFGFLTKEERSKT